MSFLPGSMFFGFADPEGPSGPSYGAEATALFARMSVAPDATRKGHIDTLIAALKTAAVWDKLDALYVMAAHDAQAARLNWKADAFNLTAVNSPVFTADLGYTGDGATTYLSSGFVPATHGNTAQNDAHMGAWVTANDADHTNSVMGNIATYIIPFRSGDIWWQANNAGSIRTTTTGAIGHTAWTRRAALEAEIYKNGVSLATNTALASTAEETNEYYILARRNSTTFTSVTTRTVGAAHWGVGLTDTEHGDLHAALATYMTAVGA